MTYEKWTDNMDGSLDIMDNDNCPYCDSSTGFYYYLSRDLQLVDTNGNRTGRIECVETEASRLYCRECHSSYLPHIVSR